MAIRAYDLREYYRYRIYVWELNQGDTGQAIVEAAHYPDKTVQVYGTFGSGGSVRIEGSNDDVGNPVDFEYDACHDTTETTLDITARGHSVILENNHVIRPRVTAGDANTALIVKMAITIGQGGGR